MAGFIPTDAGAGIKTVLGTASIADDAAAPQTGAGIDRLGFDSCILQANVGAPTGAPASFTFDARLQDSADDGAADPYADLKPDGVTVAALTQLTASGIGERDVNLRSAKRYIRVVHTVTLTGGTTPTLPVGTTIALGGPVEMPA